VIDNANPVPVCSLLHFMSKPLPCAGSLELPDSRIQGWPPLQIHSAANRNPTPNPPCVCVAQQNGYRMMFLSSRAIAQASTTRDYLQRLNQNGHRLPSGAMPALPRSQRFAIL